jgi:hypothetical protein
MKANNVRHTVLTQPGDNPHSLRAAGDGRKLRDREKLGRQSWGRHLQNQVAR